MTWNTWTSKTNSKSLHCVPSPRVFRSACFISNLNVWLINLWFYPFSPSPLFMTTLYMSNTTLRTTCMCIHSFISYIKAPIDTVYVYLYDFILLHRLLTIFRVINTLLLSFNERFYYLYILSLCHMVMLYSLQILQTSATWLILWSKWH